MVQKTIKEILDLKIQQTGNKRQVTHIPILTQEEYRICLQELVSLDITVLVYEDSITTGNTQYYCITEKKQIYNITRLIFLLTKVKENYRTNVQYNILSNTVHTPDITILPYIQTLYRKFTKRNTTIQNSIRKALGGVVL